MDSKENILAKIRTEHVVAALNTLPDPEKSRDKFAETVIEVPHFGLVRFTCTRFVSRHHKSSHTFWTADKAVRVN